MIRYLSLFFLLTLLAFSSFGQEENEEFAYTREFIYGFNFNTNGGLLGGLVAKHSRALNDKNYHSFGIELVNVKHKKEIKSQSQRTGNYFIYGKENYLYSVRLQYGRERILFRKAPEEGVQINGIIAGGPTIGVVAPYYIRYENSAGDITLMKFDPRENSYGRILGTGPIFKGIDESEVKIGVNLKAALSFEFGTFKSSVAGFEAGFLIEAFPEKIILIPSVQNRSVFTSGFFTLYYGIRR